jgi:AsmA protein
LPIGLAPNQTTDLALLDAIDLDLRLSAEEAKVGPLTIANAAGAIRISKGEADLDLGTGTLGGGTVIGRLKLSGPANAKLGDLKMQMTNLRQDQLEDLAQNIPNHTGAISGKLALTGPYSGIQSFLEKANGALEVNTGLGLVRNFNLETFQDALGQKGFFELASVFQGVTEIKPVALTAQVKSGVAIVSPTDVLVGGRRVIVSGAVPFLSRGLALNGVIAGLPGEALDPNPLPFFIGGVWSKPLVTTTTSQ